MRRTRRPVVFLDRDGTLIHDRPGYYLARPEEVRLYRGVPEALRLLRRAGYALVVVSNQSGLARGVLDETMLERVHARLKSLLRRGGARLDGIYYCPHHPDDGCRCRKPQPTLARRAARDLSLDLEGSFVVGDKRADVDLGRRLGATTIHLLTGHGRHQRRSHGAGLRPDRTCRTLLEAARWILKR